MQKPSSARSKLLEVPHKGLSSPNLAAEPRGDSYTEDGTRQSRAHVRQKHFQGDSNARFERA